jgi:predicted metal-dependent peptidase
MELDYNVLDKELARIKAKMFLGNNAAFLAPIMFGLDFRWVEDLWCNTAATDGERFFWKPLYFHHLKESARISIVTHEIWHVARLHHLRRGSRDPKRWNYACDTVLDNFMDYEGYDMVNLFPVEAGFAPGTKPLINHDYDGLSEEEIYDIMEKDAIPIPDWYVPTLMDPKETQVDPQKILNHVVSAFHSATMSGGAGNIPGDVKEIINKFLKPKLPWERLVYNWFNELGGEDYSLARPNRRYLGHDLYLPSVVPDREGLDHIRFYEDVSGSVGDQEVLRFNSEVKYLKDTFNPKMLTLIQFDTKIQSVIEFTENDPFDEVVIVGRGGTSLEPVWKDIVEHRPTAVIIFSDLQCKMMRKLPFDIPLIWVAVNNRKAHVHEGLLIHIKE